MKTELPAVRLMPVYLAVQGAILVMTFLDFPVYMISHRVYNNMLVTPWAAAWLVLLIVGLVFGGSALIRKVQQPGRLAAGYLLGAIAGLLTLGIRFFSVLPRQYFYIVGILILVFLGAYLAWRVRTARNEEIFP